MPDLNTTPDGTPTFASRIWFDDNAGGGIQDTTLAAVSGLILKDWTNLGNLGATETVAGVDDQIYRAYGTLDQNCTITVSMAANQQVDLLLVQDGTGGRTVTFSGVDAWSGDTPNLAGRAASVVDRFAFEDVNGTTYGYWLTDDKTVQEAARDALGAALVEGTGIDIAVNDGANTITVSGLDASDTVKGVVELATSAETTTGTDTARAVTPAGVQAVRDLLIPKALVDAKGDLIVATAADTVNRLAVGATNGHVLKVASGETSGLQWQGESEVIVVAVGDETTALTTGDAKVTFRMPFAMTLTAVRASLTTASSSGTPTINIREGGTDILSTALTIDANELTSTTAATAAVISDSTLADDAEIKIDVDTAGTGAAGLKVALIGRRA